MPSAVVHVGAGLLLGALLLDDAFSGRAILAVALATPLPDVDAFVGLVVANTHRAAMHNVFLPVVLGAALVYDCRIAETSRLRRWFGPNAARIAAVAVVSLAVAGVGLDYVTNGVNLLYPLHDQFYTLSGRLELTSTRGLVQTFLKAAPAHPATTANTHYATAINPTGPGQRPTQVVRIAPVVESGWQLWLVLVGLGAVAWRCVADRAAGS